MKLLETDYPAVRGYMVVPQEVFDQITPFLMRDQEKMQRLLRDMPIEARVPDFIMIRKEEADRNVPCIEWSGYIIVAESPKE